MTYSLFDRLADYGDDGIEGNLVDSVVQRLVLALFDGNLYLAGDILEHDERHLALVADVLNEAADLNLVRAVNLSRVSSFHSDSSDALDSYRIYYTCIFRQIKP